ncbi:uracil phosphoribosyltransferase homolog [Eriocheir sinensis]|uniref:uracil phosphoribosyltransferase homolog n=1 Tax=Eriocheir sinensis TaxID=95602 RepID=UPI0021C62B9B|nr:uracil phosphoribosyltransferase homolog [Eriocheir sinensis]
MFFPPSLQIRLVVEEGLNQFLYSISLRFYNFLLFSYTFTLSSTYQTLPNNPSLILFFLPSLQIRLVVEEGLNQLPYSDLTITTPTGCQYQGLQFVKGNCGVSIVRSGEAMEQGLRSCCRSIRLGKILVESDLETHEARVVYAKFPDDISQRKVLLMYPIMSSGNTVIKAVNVLQEHAVEEENIILLNLFSTPAAARTVTSAFPRMHILTSEVHPVAPNHFGQKYFGTD